MKMILARVLCSLSVVAWALPAIAAEDAYPSGRITLVVPFASGGATDSLARLIAQKMSASVKQAVVVENKPGAGGSIGSLEVARAPADGYTILLGTSSTHGVNPWIYKLPYDVTKDFAPIAMLATGEYALAINPKFNPDIKTVSDLLALAKSRRVTYASQGNGTNSHLAAALLSKITGVEFAHIPYKSQAPAQVDLLAGHVDFMIDAIATTLPHAKSGALRVLATTGRTRAAVFKDVPTMIEAGVPGYEMMGWYVLLAPAATPVAIINRLNAEVLKAIDSADVRERMLVDGNTPYPTSPAEARDFMASQLIIFRQAVDVAGAKVD